MMLTPLQAYILGALTGLVVWLVYDRVVYPERFKKE